MAFCIFISHSSHSEADRVFVQELHDLLEANGYDVRLDRRDLKPADYWNEELDEWLAECHAGVLLLTPQSIDRPWVLKEATILSWRSSRDKNFLLFPALFDGVTNKMLEEGRFAPLVLNALQKVTGKTAAQIAAEITAVFGPPAARDTPLDALAKTLTDLLVPPNVGGSVAERLARKLGIDETRWVPGETPEFTRIRLIAGRLVRESLGGYGGVYDLMKDLVTTMSSKSTAHQVLDIVAPYWVSPASAGLLYEVARRKAGWAIAMNGAHVSNFTLERHLLRAFQLEGGIYELKVPGGGPEGMVTEMIEMIYTQLQEFWEEDREEVKKVLATHEDPLFVALPKEFHDEEALKTLRDEFPQITFVLNVGPDAKALAALAKLPKVELLRPAVDLHREEAAFSDNVRVRGLIKNKFRN